MKVIQDSLDQFIAGKKSFTIPVYQRKYDWQKIHCQQLFDDIKRIIVNDKPHFLGTFVYQKKLIAGSNNFEEYIIIDGQQRITSIILLAKALLNFIEDEEIREEILDNLIKHSNGKGMKNKCKLNPTDYDKNIFEKIMNQDIFDESSFDDDEKNFGIYKNYLFFKEKISECEYSADEIYNAIQRLNIVGINVEIGENPQEIFESLNSTGLYLTQSDLIRNYLLMSLDYDCQEEFYKKYWLEMEKLLKSTDSVENFMVQYLIVKRKSDSLTQGNKKIRLSAKNLYSVFRRYFEEKYLDDDKTTNVENCFADMYRYVKFYKKFIFDDNDDFDKLSALEKKFYELTYLLAVNNAPIILMYLYDKFDRKFFDEKSFMEFLNAMISLSFRAKVCGFNGITAQFAGNIIMRLDKIKFWSAESFWQVITFGKGNYAFPKDEIFRKYLVSKEIFITIKSDACKYLLYSLEKNSVRSAELPKYSVATVEHIMPQKLSDGWKNYLQSKQDLTAHEFYLHTLGNLTLMAGKYNSQVGNSDFGKKKIEYANSAFFYTNDLQKYSDWTSKQIQLRAQKLANEAVKIWTLPEKYNFAIFDVGNIVTLDSDFGIFTGRKPDILSVSDKEQPVKFWRDILREVIRILYNRDSDSFRQAVLMENVPRRANLFHDTETINKTYIENLNFNFDTESCLKITKKLVENFDSICGTNFKEEIWFTLKK